MIDYLRNNWSGLSTFLRNNSQGAILIEVKNNDEMITKN